MHEAFHVIALIGFMIAAAFAFVGIISPMLFPEGGGFRLLAFKSAIILAGLAAVGLVADRVLHSLLGY